MKKYWIRLILIRILNLFLRSQISFFANNGVIELKCDFADFRLFYNFKQEIDAECPSILV